MKRVVLSNGIVRLTADNGVIDTRNGGWYSTADVKLKDEKFFKEA